MVGHEFPLFLRHKDGEIAVILCPYTQLRAPTFYMNGCRYPLPPLHVWEGAGWQEISRDAAIAALERVAD